MRDPLRGLESVLGPCNGPRGGPRGLAGERQLAVSGCECTVSSFEAYALVFVVVKILPLGLCLQAVFCASGMGQEMPS